MARGRFSLRGTDTRISAIVLLTIGLPLVATAGGRAQPEDLQTRKLQLEIAALERQPSPWVGPAVGAAATVLSVVGGLIGGFVGVMGALRVARRNREGELDQAVHEQRIESYPELVQTARPLAVYFPEYPSGRALEPAHCAQIGAGMSAWYFRGGGLLLSTQAREAYFALTQALTRASRANELRVPTFPHDAASINAKAVGDFRTKLQGVTAPSAFETWEFGAPVTDPGAPEQRFRDYVFLQYLSSTLRSELASDIGGRRRPETTAPEESRKAVA